jgi:hypothetical protein
LTNGLIIDKEAIIGKENITNVSESTVKKVVKNKSLRTAKPSKKGTAKLVKKDKKSISNRERKIKR